MVLKGGSHALHDRLVFRRAVGQPGQPRDDLVERGLLGFIELAGVVQAPARQHSGHEHVDDVANGAADVYVRYPELDED